MRRHVVLVRPSACWYPGQHYGGAVQGAVQGAAAGCLHLHAGPQVRERPAGHAAQSQPDGLPGRVQVARMHERRAPSTSVRGAYIYRAGPPAGNRGTDV